MELFGINLSRKKKSDGVTTQKNESPIPKPQVEGEITISAGGFQGQYLASLDQTFSNLSESELITRYREAAEHPECESAISDIIDEAISNDDDGSPVELNLDNVNVSAAIKKKITDEFWTVTKLLNFSEDASDIFKKWYVDGRLYYHIVPGDNDREGLSELRAVDPIKIRKVREVRYVNPKTVGGAQVEEVVAEYYVYSDQFTNDTKQTTMTISAGGTVAGVKITPDSIVYIPSGVVDPGRRRVLSHLQKALKPLNQLRMMEDALVIYRITRAPERRIFYIDVGNLPKGKAEEYVQGIMNKYRNKQVYDATTGETRDDRRHMSMLEDFFLPRREGGRGTEISTLPGGENLGQIEDIIFFQKKLYRALNVPAARLEQETNFNLGRTSEITREELKFQKFINRLRKKFSQLLLDLLRVQLILKNVVTEEEWNGYKEDIAIDFKRDNYFSELKDAEILRERLQTLESVSSHIGTYYSKEWVRRNILKQSDDVIETIDKAIALELKSGELAEVDDEEA
jgi:hypothetical protein